MRLLTAVLAGVFCIFCLEFAAAAEPPETLTQRYVSEPTSFPIRVEILREITNLKADPSEPHISTWLDQLGTIYSKPRATVLWTTPDGYNRQALKILGGYEQAEAWGLKPSDYQVPDFSGIEIDPARRAEMEVAFSLVLLKYASHARGGRVDPSQLSLWFDRRARPVDAFALMELFGSTDEPVQELERLHPQHEQFHLLRQAYLALKSPEGLKVKRNTPPIIPDADKIRPGERHPQIPLIRRRLGLPAKQFDILRYDDELLAAVQRFMRNRGWKRKKVIDRRVRKALNKDARNQAKNKGPKVTEKLLLVNMEKWRWMPADLGRLHILNNLPSFQTSVVKDGRVIHSERIIVGKTKMQTPVFSDEMTHIVFKPEWGVPSSIKIKSLLPRLLGGDYGVLARRGMKIKYDSGLTKHPSRYNWSRTDIRYVPIVMGAGPSNPLGRVKFIFPNQHSVYMHDTPDKWLFKKTSRTFSHGCIRVRNPQRLAEVLLNEIHGWNEKKIASLMTRKADSNNKIELPTVIPVHNAYFTLVVDPATKDMVSLRDMYGHDRRILAALGGKSAAAIARSDPARAHQREIEALAKARPVYKRRRRHGPRNARLQALRRPAAQPQFWFYKPKPIFKAKKQKRRRISRSRRPKRRPFTINAYQRY